MKTGVQRYLIVQSEGASANYNTDFVDRLFREEGQGEVYLKVFKANFIKLKFSTRVNVLGHAQQGITYILIFYLLISRRKANSFRS